MTRRWLLFLMLFLMSRQTFRLFESGGPSPCRTRRLYSGRPWLLRMRVQTYIMKSSKLIDSKDIELINKQVYLMPFILVLNKTLKENLPTIVYFVFKPHYFLKKKNIICTNRTIYLYNLTFCWTLKIYTVKNIFWSS